MKVTWPQPFEDGNVQPYLEDFEEAAEVAVLDTDRAKQAVPSEFDTPAGRQEPISRFKTDRMGHECDPTVFFASLRQSFDRVLPELGGMSRHQCMASSSKVCSLRFVTAVVACSHQDRIAESDRTARCYKCGMTGHRKNQCHRTRPLVNNKTLDYSSFPGWVAISAVTQATIQTNIDIDGKRELRLIDTGAGISLRRRGNEAECKPYAIAVRAVGGYRLKIDRLSMHLMRLSNKSLQHALLISADIGQIIFGADILKSTDSVIHLNRRKLATKYGSVKIEGYPSTAVGEPNVRKLPSCKVPSVQSVDEEYSEQLTGDEDPFGFCLWIEQEVISSECFRHTSPVRCCSIYGREACVKWSNDFEVVSIRGQMPGVHFDTRTVRSGQRSFKDNNDYEVEEEERHRCLTPSDAINSKETFRRYVGVHGRKLVIKKSSSFTSHSWWFIERNKRDVIELQNRLADDEQITFASVGTYQSFYTEMGDRLCVTLSRMVQIGYLNFVGSIRIFEGSVALNPVKMKLIKMLIGRPGHRNLAKTTSAQMVNLPPGLTVYSMLKCIAFCLPYKNLNFLPQQFDLSLLIFVDIRTVSEKVKNNHGNKKAILVARCFVGYRRRHRSILYMVVTTYRNLQTAKQLATISQMDVKWMVNFTLTLSYLSILISMKGFVCVQVNHTAVQSLVTELLTVQTANREDTTYEEIMSQIRAVSSSGPDHSPLNLRFDSSIVFSVFVTDNLFFPCHSFIACNCVIWFLRKIAFRGNKIRKPRFMNTAEAAIHVYLSFALKYPCKLNI
ncbi:gap-Pol polyprotein [Clonorchis sinensis]|uniref:Gap-Pol polyprotein n=1 Tax=Clonorchis sinensis TaxID=79923 RepID=G7YCN5_CLOSI|nr:gap-Pol polyprotein [Clonorchis sinensis]